MSELSVGLRSIAPANIIPQSGGERGCRSASYMGGILNAAACRRFRRTLQAKETRTRPRSSLLSSAYNTHMRSFVFLLLLGGLASWSAAQEPPAEKGPWSQPPPTDRSQEAGESSSRDTRIDLSPPKDDAKNHQNCAQTSRQQAGPGPVQCNGAAPGAEAERWTVGLYRVR